jgi:hypothetical protein
MVKDLKTVCGTLEELGADIVLIDGAFDRKSFASPLVAHATILATGAALSHDMDEVISQTRFNIQTLSTPAMNNKNLKTKIEQFFSTYKSGVMDEQDTLIKFDVNTALNATSHIITSLSASTRYILIKGIVGSDLIEQLLHSNVDLTNISIIAEDGTKIFVQPQLLTQFYDEGGIIEVLHPIHILAVTANPVSPYGFQFNQQEFLTRLRDQLQVPVFDIVSGG